MAMSQDLIDFDEPILSLQVESALLDLSPDDCGQKKSSQVKEGTTVPSFEVMQYTYTYVPQYSTLDSSLSSSESSRDDNADSEGHFNRTCSVSRHSEEAASISIVTSNPESVISPRMDELIRQRKQKERDIWWGKQFGIEADDLKEEETISLQREQARPRSGYIQDGSAAYGRAGFRSYAREEKKRNGGYCVVDPTQDQEFERAYNRLFGTRGGLQRYMKATFAPVIQNAPRRKNQASGGHQIIW